MSLLLQGVPQDERGDLPGYLSCQPRFSQVTLLTITEENNMATRGVISREPKDPQFVSHFFI